MDKERQLVERIARAVPSVSGSRRFPSLPLGIGDDAAILSPNRSSDWVLSCDAFLERVHFLPNSHSPDSVGYKSLVRAASDLVAVGATPRYFLMTLALPASRIGTWLDAFLSGLGRAARSLRMRLIGGDTSRHGIVSISITVIGEIPRGRALTRSGAKPGDLIYVTGRLGRAQLGLELLRKNLGLRREFRKLVRPHFYPQIEVKLGEWIARNRVASAMMDISDGLSTDLVRLCGASGVGARIDSSRVPRVAIPASLARATKKWKLDPLQLALHGGDDYGLLCTIPPRHAKKFRRALGASSLTEIGEITRGKQIRLVSDDGTATPLDPLGWDPFNRR